MCKTMSCVLTAAMIVGLAMPSSSVAAAKKVPKLSNKKISIKVGEKKTIKVKNATKKVKWSVKSGKKYVTLSGMKKTSAVVKGKEIGRTIGYPTANIIYPLDIVEPPYGVYDVEVELPDGTTKRGLANFGVSPTVSNDGIKSLEVFIIDFDGDLYDKDIRVSFNRMIRPEIKFNGLDELKTQIDCDIQSMF